MTRATSNAAAGRAPRRRTGRRAVVVALGVLLALALVGTALGDEPQYRGTDVFGDLAATDGLRTSEMDRYPLGRYTLDWFIDSTSGNGPLPDTPRPSTIPAVIAQTLAGWLWGLTKVMVSFVITLVSWAFSFNLISPEPGAGTDALNPIAKAITRIREGLIGDAWLAVGLTVAGLWALYNAFGRDRKTETVGQLLASLALVVVGFAFVTGDQWVVRKVNDGTSQMASSSLASVAAGASVAGDDGGETSAKREVSDALFETLIVRPWTALEFGGLDHCTNGSGEPMACNGSQARRIDHLPARLRSDGRSLSTVAGQGNYLDRYLRHPPADDVDSPRGKEFEALGKGQATDGATDDKIESGAGGVIDKHDRPAVDLQLGPGSDQRLVMAALIFGLELGAVLLVGGLALGVVLTQAFVLLLVAFAPVFLVLAAVPRFGHDLFIGWLKRIGWLLVAEVLLALVLAVLLIVSQALGDASSALNWQIGLVLQGVFFWAVWLSRHRLLGAAAGVPRREVPRINLRRPAARTVGGGRRVVDRATTALAAAAGGAYGATRQRVSERGAERDRRRELHRATGRDDLRRAAHQRLEAETAGRRRRVEQEETRRAELRSLQVKPARTQAEEARLAELRARAPDSAFAHDRDKRELEEIEARKRAGQPPYTDRQYRAKEAEIERRPAPQLPDATGRNGAGARNGSERNGKPPAEPAASKPAARPGYRRGRGRPPRRPGGDE